MPNPRQTNHPLRVLHFHFGKDGGAERFFVNLLNALARVGVQQKVVIRPKRAWKDEIDPSVEVIESYFRNASLDRLLLPLRMRRLIKDWRADAVLGWMPRGAKLIPNVAGVRRLARLGDYPESLKRFRNVDTLVCITPDLARHMRALGWTRDIQIISNFTTAEKAAPVSRAALDTPEDAFVVSAMGRFVERKGFDVALRAVAELPGVYLWLIGGGEEEDRLKALSRELGMQDRVRFAGWHKEPRPFVAASDCFVIPSHHEPLGNVVLEGWAQRVPMVATRSEGPSWAIEDGESGLMVDLGDHLGVARAIDRIRSDKALAAKLVAGGDRALETRFSTDAIVADYLALFRGQPSHS